MAADTEMTMNRVIHAAVRRDFERTATALDAFRDGDAARAAELGRAWDHLASQLTHHHEQEDTLIWPALQTLGVDPVLLGEMESEHQAMHDALVGVSAEMTRLAGSARKEDATAAAVALEHARAVTERHLRHEEDELEPQMVQHFESRGVEGGREADPQPVAPRRRRLLRLGARRAPGAGGGARARHGPGAGDPRDEPGVRDGLPPQHRPDLAPLTEQVHASSIVRAPGAHGQDRWSGPPRITSPAARS